MTGRALVLGGGGVTGVAWEIGMLLGLAERGVDLTGADLFVGTSAGAVTAAQVTTGRSLEEMFEGQLAPHRDEASHNGDTGHNGHNGEASHGDEASHNPEAGHRGKTGHNGEASDKGEAGHRGGAVPSIGTPQLLKLIVAGLWPGDPRKGRAWLGRAALRARTVPESARREAIAERVDTAAWPVTPLKITAVEAETGEFVVFDKASGVSLIDAVAASCAVPLVWPPMTVNGVRYIDGGMRSVANVDLAAGSDRVIVIAPITASVRRSGKPQVQAQALGIPQLVVSPTDAALTAIGRNPLDPARRAPSAKAGRAQAAEVADQVRALWT